MSSDKAISLAVLGGGSAGVGAAVAASRLGVDTVLIERDAMLGGTSTVAGVHCWEPAVGATGLPCEFYKRMSQIPQATGIYSLGRHAGDPKHNNPPFPGAENVLDRSCTYENTLRRFGLKGLRNDSEQYRNQLHGVIFEPLPWHTTAMSMLAETGRCQVRLCGDVTLVRRNEDEKTVEVVLADGTVIRARYWIDTAGFAVRSLGGRCCYGNDPANPYLDGSDAKLNGVTRIFRIAPVESPRLEPLESGIPEHCWWRDEFPVMVCTTYPNGDRNCNMLPTFDGDEFCKLPEDEADREGVQRVKSYWHYVQKRFPEFQRYRLACIFPRAGIRETFQVECEYMLQADDLLAGCNKQSHSDVIALADHAMDIHGFRSSVCRELPHPYGVPFRCLLPKGCSNGLVAGRIAGFTKKAASSCRLARTMMMLGEAAGTAAAMAIQSACDMWEIDINSLRNQLRKQGVTLDM